MAELRALVQVWEQLCPDATLAGMTLAAFQAKLKVLEDLLTEMRGLRLAYSGKISVRFQFGDGLNDDAARIVSFIRSSPDRVFAENFLRSLGYKMRNEIEPPHSDDAEGELPDVA
jgi:hypothetical protein